MRQGVGSGGAGEMCVVVVSWYSYYALTSKIRKLALEESEQYDGAQVEPRDVVEVCDFRDFSEERQEFSWIKCTKDGQEYSGYLRTQFLHKQEKAKAPVLNPAASIAPAANAAHFATDSEPARATCVPIPRKWEERAPPKRYRFVTSPG